MIKVLNILTDSNIGGAGRCLVNYLKYCDRNRFAPVVVLPVGSLLISEVQKLEIPVITAEGIAERSFSAGAISQLHRIIRQEKPQIVHTHGSFSGRIAARIAGCKVVYTRHSAFPVPAYLRKAPGKWINGAVNSFFAHSIIAVSPATEKNLTDSGVPAKKITTMMNGTEPVKPASQERCGELRRELNLPAEVFTAGILARLEEYKGHMILLDAAKKLMDQGLDFRILIGGSGPCQDAIQEAIRQLGLSEKVLFLGFVENVSEILSILDVQLNCSYGTEASSIALIEGMSLGLPTVASDYGGNPWQITDGVTGLLFRSGDSADLACKLRCMMEQSELRLAMHDNALRDYHTRFTGDVFAENIETVYGKTLNMK